MTKRTLVAGWVLVSTLIACSVPSAALAKDPYGNEANYAAAQMYLHQQANQQYGNGYGNGYGNANRYGNV